MLLEGDECIEESEYHDQHEHERPVRERRRIETVREELRHSRTEVVAERVSEVAGNRSRQYDDGERENQRNHARRVHAQRQEGGAGLTLHPAAAEHAAPVLHRNAPLRFREQHDGVDYDECEDRQQQQARALLTFQQALPDDLREARDDAAEYD